MSSVGPEVYLACPYDTERLLPAKYMSVASF